MRCAAQLLAEQAEEEHHLGRERSRGAEALRKEEHLCNEPLVRAGHRRAAEQGAQVVWQARAAGVRRVHGDKHAGVLVHVECAPHELDGRAGREPLLDRLYLLRDAAEHALLEPVELVKAAKRTDAAYAEEQAAHRLEVKLPVAVEDEHEAAERGAERLDGLGLARARGPEALAETARAQRLGERKEHGGGQRRLYEALRRAEILEPVGERGVRQAHADALRGRRRRIEVVAQLREPRERRGGRCVRVAEVHEHLALVRQLGH